MIRTVIRILTVLLGCMVLVANARAEAESGGLYSCDQETVSFDWPQTHRLFTLAARIEQLLAASGRDSVLVSRSGTDLKEFGLNYSHMGVASRDNPLVAWGVTQLYYACKDGHSSLFDQGLTDFVAEQRSDFVRLSLVFLSPARSQQLHRMIVGDRAMALQLLAAHYSANAFPFSTLYQNCNQWLIELMATAWSDTPLLNRSEAQRWLMNNAYNPSRVRLPHWWFYMVPWFTSMLHNEDQPAALHGVYQVSTPEAIEDFIRGFDVEATRLEICMTPDVLIVHPGWTVLDAACNVTDADEVSTY